jgi:hypothetical protein
MLRGTNAMLEERVQLVIQRAASAHDATKVLTARLASVERERDAVRAMINVERYVRKHSHLLCHFLCVITYERVHRLFRFPRLRYLFWSY